MAHPSSPCADPFSRCQPSPSPSPTDLGDCQQRSQTGSEQFRLVRRFDSALSHASCKLVISLRHRNRIKKLWKSRQRQNGFSCSFHHPSPVATSIQRTLSPCERRFRTILALCIGFRYQFQFYFLSKSPPVSRSSSRPSHPVSVARLTPFQSPVSPRSSRPSHPVAVARLTLFQLRVLSCAALLYFSPAFRSVLTVVLTAAKYF